MMKRVIVPSLTHLLLLMILTGLSRLSAQDNWPRFRGLNGSGLATAKNITNQVTPDSFRWVAQLPGSGHSSPVVWNDRLYVTCADEKSSTRFLICLNTTDGTELWRREFALTPYRKHKNNSFASSTPCVDEHHVYVVWHSKESSPLLALDHTGQQVWSYQVGAYQHGQGGAASPIVYDDLVVLPHDQKQPSFLLAVDRMTGTERWKIPREGKRACYSTPCIRSGASGDEIVFTHCYEGIIGVAPKSGRINWHIDVFGRASQRALGSPVVAGPLVIATSGAVGGDRQLVVVHPEAEGNKVTVREVWRTTRQTPHVPTPLVRENRLFLVSDQGIASCLDVSTGDVIWKERLGGTYFSSPVCINDRIYCIDLDGKVSVFRAADSFKLLGRSSLPEGTKATPAVAHDTLYIRTDSKVFAIAGRPE